MKLPIDDPTRNWQLFVNTKTFIQNTEVQQSKEVNSKKTRKEGKKDAKVKAEGHQLKVNTITF